MNHVEYRVAVDGKAESVVTKINNDVVEAKRMSEDVCGMPVQNSTSYSAHTGTGTYRYYPRRRYYRYAHHREDAIYDALCRAPRSIRQLTTFCQVFSLL